MSWVLVVVVTSATRTRSRLSDQIMERKHCEDVRPGRGSWLIVKLSAVSTPHHTRRSHRHMPRFQESCPRG
jgi:hypothetical protein